MEKEGEEPPRGRSKVGVWRAGRGRGALRGAGGRAARLWL